MENGDALAKMVESRKELRWMAAAWALFFVMATVGTAIQGTLVGVVWGNLTPQEKFMKITGISVQVSITMGAFISKAFSKIKEGKDPIKSDTAPPFHLEKKP